MHFLVCVRVVFAVLDRSRMKFASDTVKVDFEGSARDIRPSGAMSLRPLDKAGYLKSEHSLDTTLGRKKGNDPGIPTAERMGLSISRVETSNMPMVHASHLDADTDVYLTSSEQFFTMSDDVEGGHSVNPSSADQHVHTGSTFTKTAWSRKILNSPKITVGMPANKCGAGKLLLIISLGGPDVLTLLNRNLKQLRYQLKKCFDVFVLNYGGMDSDKKVAWALRKEGVQMLFNFQSMHKFWMVHAAISSFSMIKKYDWVWALDEDIDLLEIDTAQFLSVATETGALIVAPAQHILDGQDCNSQTCLFQAKHKCKFRYTNFVGVMAPMLRPKTLWNMLTCKECMHRDSVSGLDHVWCKRSARLQKQDSNKTCAILDEYGFIQTNSKDDMNMEKMDKHEQTMYLHFEAEVLKNHVEDWVMDPLDTTCMSSDVNYSKQE